MFAALLILAQATTCTTNGNITRCVDDRPPLDYQAIMNRGRAMVPQYNRRPRPDPTRGRVVDLVRAGRCADAKAVALDAGDLDLAEQSQRLCVAR